MQAEPMLNVNCALLFPLWSGMSFALRPTYGLNGALEGGQRGYLVHFLLDILTTSHFLIFFLGITNIIEDRV